DDAIRLVRDARDDLRDRVTGDRDPTERRGERLGRVHRAIRPQIAASRLLRDRFCDFPGLEAPGADVRALGLPVQEDADALEVRVEAPLRGHHRMAPVVAEARLLPA